MVLGDDFRLLEEQRPSRPQNLGWLNKVKGCTLERGGCL